MPICSKWPKDPNIKKVEKDPNRDSLSFSELIHSSPNYLEKQKVTEDLLFINKY